MSCAGRKAFLSGGVGALFLVLAHFILKERLHIFGIVGCILIIVLFVLLVFAFHAPKERETDPMEEIWHLATQLVFRFPPVFQLSAI
jgi:Na+/melibiose symporter-like transporter